MINKMSWKSNWESHLIDKEFQKRFLFTIIFLTVSIFAFANYLQYNETRNGFVFDDPILSLFNAIEFNAFIFILIYGALVLGVASLSFHPKELIIALQTYALLSLIRLVAMYSLPLEPPIGLIPLIDPFVQFFGGGGTQLNKDLFFSGHTSTMFLLFLTSQNKKLKTLFLGSTFIVGASVLLQQTHYTVDVIAAPFFCYGAFRAVYLINQKLYGDLKNYGRV